MYRAYEDELLVAVLVVDGEVGHDNYESLLADLERLMDGGSRAVLLDFSTTTFVDGACLGVLFLALRRLGPAGRLVVAGAGDDLRRMFRVGGLTSLSSFELFESRDEALSALLRDQGARTSAAQAGGRRRRRSGRTASPSAWSPSRDAPCRRSCGRAIFGLPSLADRIHD